MIVQTINDSNPSSLTGFLTKQVVTAINPSITANTITTCEYEECCDRILALAGGDNLWENDKAFFLFKAPYDSGEGLLINLYLQKDEVDVVQLDGEDVDMGFYFGPGTWNTTNDQLLYAGFELNWSQVLIDHGHGNYRVRAEILIGEQTPIEQYSECYEVYEYSCERAEGTVYLEWYQNGEMKFGMFNYKDMNIWQYRRVKGKFGQWTPTIEKDSVLYSNYYEKQIQDSVPNKYTLETALLRYDTSKKLVQDMMLADDILITDYNLSNHRNDYIRFKVRQDEIEMNNPSGHKLVQLNLTFTDRTKNFIKNS